MKKCVSCNMPKIKGEAKYCSDCIVKCKGNCGGLALKKIGYCTECALECPDGCGKIILRKNKRCYDCNILCLGNCNKYVLNLDGYRYCSSCL